MTYQSFYPCFPYYVGIVAGFILWYSKYELTGTADKSNDTNHKIGELSPNKKSRYCLATVNGEQSTQIKSSELLA